MSDNKNLPTVASVDRAMFDDLVNRGDPLFLKRLALAQGLSDSVKKRKAQLGDFTVGVGEDLVNLGPEVKMVVGPMRPHALHLIDGEVEAESFNPDDSVFKKIQQKALAKGKRQQGDSPMFGVDCLFFIPSHGLFVTYFFSKTARREARPLFELAGQLIELYSVEVEGKNNSWFVPRVQKLDQAANPPPVIDSSLHATALASFNVGGGAGVEDEEDDTTEEKPVR
jgi:hypothetical protein